MSPSRPLDYSQYKHDISRLRRLYPGVGASAQYSPAMFDTEPFNEGAGWPTGNRVREELADYMPTSTAQLRTAVEEATQGQLIYLPPWCDYDVSGVQNLTPAQNVTIAGGRGTKRSRPAAESGARLLIHSKNATSNPVFQLDNPGVRMHGIQFEGWQTAFREWPGYDGANLITGVAIDADRCQIDGCVFRGFTHAGVVVGRDGAVDRTHVHHCDFVDNPADGLGYGVVVFHGNPLIQQSYFDHNRHSIAADGYGDCQYIARYNLVGSHPISHQFDMHGQEDHEVNGRPRAGQSVSIHHNVFEATNGIRNGHQTEAVKIRGQPTEKAQVVQNWFAHGQARPHVSQSDGAAIQLEYGGVGEDWVELSVDGSGDTNRYGLVVEGSNVGI